MDNTQPAGTTIQWKHWEGVVPQYIRYACFTWQFVKFAFIFYLCVRQDRVLNERRRIPRVMLGKLPPQAFERARTYHIALNYLKMASCVYWIAHETWLVLWFGFTKMWFISGPILTWLNIWPDDWDRETGESIMFVVVMMIHRNFTPLPINLYKTFVIEEKYGFNKMTVGAFLLDFGKMCIFECVYFSIYGIFVLWIVRETGKWFFIWLWIFSFFWLLITLAIYPNFIAPIFDNYTPLREGRLKSRLRRLANFLGFPLEEILVKHQDWRSEHRSAYFYGLLGSKRIVLYDTLLAGYPEADDPQRAQRRVRRHVANPQTSDSEDSMQDVPSRILERARMSQVDNTSEPSNVDQAIRRRATTYSRVSMYDAGFTEYEIEAVVARLMGHWVLGHSVRELIFPVVSMFLFFLIFSLLYENSSLFQAFDVPRGMDKPILLGLRLLLMDVMDIYRIFVESVMKHLARQRVYEADAFATRLGYGEDLIDAYIEAEKENLDYPYFDTWYYNFHFNEPSVLHSIEAIQGEITRMDWHLD